MLLAADIGGTKTELGIFSPEAGARAPLARAVFKSADYPSLAAVVQAFLAGGTWPIEVACFDVAGPVVNGVADVTNLDWVINAEQLRTQLRLPAVLMLNDLQAVAQAIPLLEPGDLHTLNAGVPVPQGACAVVAPGTGLGEAFLTYKDGRYQAHPSEGGHADFGPNN